MELKYLLVGAQIIKKPYVLIVPLWNWNRIYAKFASFEPLCSNRTFMELKLVLFALSHSAFKGSNRTFMELKYCRRTYSPLLVLVLIVPLWNWNSLACSSTPHPPPVLIVPLWNWNKAAYTNWCRIIKCSNRTFMELKFLRIHFLTVSVRVLIVPLWNWNLTYLYW